VVGGSYGGNMRAAHGWVVAALLALILAPFPAAVASPRAFASRAAGASPQAFVSRAAGASPQRIVSTNLCADEYVFRLMPRDRIVALSFEATDRHPVVSTIADRAQGIPTIRPSAETVLGFAPDLVVMYAGTLPQLHAELARIGVPVLDVPWAGSLDDVRKTTRMLGGKLGAPERAQKLLAQMDRSIARARAVAPRPPVRTLVYEPNGYSTADGVTQEIMTLSGLAAIAPELKPTRADTIPVEEVVAHPPELLILSGDARNANARADLVQHHPALASLSARALVAWAPLTPLLCAGPWSLDAAATFTALAKEARRDARARR
jgi:iron complex transport system substrate-binding protein